MTVLAIPRWAWMAIGGVVLLVAFYLVLDAYGDSRFKAGKSKADMEWQQASDKVIAEAQNNAAAADKTQAVQAAEFALKVNDEKERINGAQQNGTSPFDVMFGNSQ
jgi:hypothetical protein